MSTVIDQARRYGWIVAVCFIVAIVGTGVGTYAEAGTPLAAKVNLQARDQAAEGLLNAALSGPNYWDSASVIRPTNQPFDEIRLRPSDDGEGYMAMISGQGGQDFTRELVVQTVFETLDRLPKYVSGAKHIVHLGRGIDPDFGVPYRDSFYYLDLSFFYATYAQRMYQIEDGERSIVYFEKLDASFVEPSVWAKYEQEMKETSEGVKRRWAPLNSVIPIDGVFGMYIISPGDSHTSRVTLVSKIRFGEGAGWLIKFASEMPAVIKSGLKSGFNGCVKIAEELKAAG